MRKIYPFLGKLSVAFRTLIPLSPIITLITRISIHHKYEFKSNQNKKTTI